MSDPSTTNKRNTKPLTKQSQRSRKRPYLVHQRAARISAAQLTLPFASQDGLIQASDAEVPIHSAEPVSANPRAKATYIYSYLRWVGN